LLIVDIFNAEQEQEASTISTSFERQQPGMSELLALNKLIGCINLSNFSF